MRKGKITGKMIFNGIIDNNIKVECELSTKQGGEYRKTPFKFPERRLCDFLNDDEYFYEEMCQHSTWHKPFLCPQSNVRKHLENNLKLFNSKYSDFSRLWNILDSNLQLRNFLWWYCGLETTWEKQFTEEMERSWWEYALMHQ